MGLFDSIVEIFGGPSKSRQDNYVCPSAKLSVEGKYAGEENIQDLRDRFGIYPSSARYEDISKRFDK